jgi:DNA-binding Xre family transcriptional regulator
LRIYARLKGANFMAVSYKKLWKLLIDKDMKKKDLCEKAGISSASVTKMGKNGHVTTEVLLKICTALNCGIDDIMEIIPERSAAVNDTV